MQDSNELKIALLSKTLLAERDEDSLDSIRLTLADLLVKEGLTPEVLCELNMYRKFHGNTSRKYQEYIERVDISVVPPNNNKLLYNRYATIAEEYAFSEIEVKEVTLVDRWGKDGKIYCTLISGVDVIFQMSVKRLPFLMNVIFGSIFRVKCHTDKKEKQIRTSCFSWNKTKVTEAKYVPLCMHKSEAGLWVRLPQRFGYVEYLSEGKKVLHIVA